MGSFRLLQFNMQFGQIWDEDDPDNAPICIEDSIRELKVYDGDIVLLQEVEQVQPGGIQVVPPPNFSRLKHELTGYESVFAYPPEDSRELPFGIGLALFSKYPILSSKTVVLPGAPVEFNFEGELTTPTDRILLIVEVDVDGTVVTFLNTHLQAYFMINASSNDHPEQKNLVLQEALKIDGPMVLAGDFNSVDAESLLEDYERAGRRTMQKDMVTWKRMPLVLDHIFINKHLELEGGTVDEVSASDHHMLVAEIKC